jgi:Fe2+ or Zn2+ uptake regulation protein
MSRRFSAQKNMIQAALHMLDHPSAYEVYEEIRKDYPQISLGTVYRNLGAMAQDGSVVRLSVSDMPDRFDNNTHEHFHAVCSGCGHIFDTEAALPEELIKQLDAAVEASTGIKVKSRSLLFFGTCPRCE